MTGGPVLPGDVVTTAPLRPEENVLFDGKRIISTAVGVAEVSRDAVRVVPTAGAYYPREGDMVVGKIVSHTSLSWNADINSCYVGFLPASDVFGRDYASHADEMSDKLRKGDMVAARVANFDRTRDPMITVSDRDLGKIDSGELYRMAPGKVPRLIGRRGSTIQGIEEATGSAITAGQNGWIVISSESADGLLRARRAVAEVDANSAAPDLADRVGAALGRR